MNAHRIQPPAARTKHRDTLTVTVLGRNGKPDRLATRMPWQAGTPAPWGKGYSRVFIDYTPAELAARKPGDLREGHEQIVRNTRLGFATRAQAIPREQGLRVVA
jgi:hypothetical protein